MADPTTSKDRVERCVRFFAAGLGATAGCIAAYYLIGWLSGSMAYRGFHAITIKTNAAFSFTVCAVAVVLVAVPYQTRISRSVAGICAATALTVGTLTLLEHIFGFDFGIDQLLATEPPGAMGVVFPNRMGPPGSASDTLCGTAILLLLMRRKKCTRLAQWLALLVCLISLLGFLGYIYSARFLYGAPVTLIAMPTTVAILLLGSGILLARPRDGMVAPIFSHDPGGAALRRLLPAAVLAPILLGWLHLQGEWHGLYERYFGTSIMVLSYVVLFSFLVYWTGRRVSRSAEALETQRRLLHVIVDEVPVGTAVIRGSDLRVQLVNPAYRAYAPGQEMAGRTLEEIWPEAAGEFIELCRQVVSSGEPHHAIDEAFLVRRLAGGPIEERYFSWSLVPVVLPEEAEKGILTLVQETTERKRTENRLLQAWSLLAGVMEGAGSRVAAIGTDLCFLALNTAYREGFRNLFGRQVQVGDHLEEAFAHLPEQAEALALWRRALEGEAFTVEQAFGGTRGERFYFEMRYSPIRDAEGRLIGATEISADISERKGAEDALKESEERLRLFFEHAPVALAMFDREMRYVSASRRWQTDYGLDGRDLRGQLHYEVFPNMSAQWREVHRRALQGEVIRAEEDPFPRADGSLQWLRWEVHPWRDTGGEIAGIVIFSEDITARKEAEEELQVRETMMNAFFAASPGILNLFDHDLRYLNCDPTTPTFYGLDRRSIIGRSAVELNPAFADQFLRPMLERVKEGGVPIANVEVSTVLPIRPAETAYFRASYFPVPLPGGQSGLGTMAVEITDIKRAEQELRKSEARINTALENLREGVVIASDAGEIFYWNASAWLMHGLMSGQEAYGSLLHLDALFELWSADGQRKLSLADWPILRVMRGERVHDLELRLRRPDQGWERIVSYSGNILETASGERLVYLSILDLTEQRTAEASLRESEAKFRAIFEQAAVGMGRASFADARWIDVNDAFCTMLGYSREQLLSIRWPEITYPDDLEQDLVPFRHMAAGELDSYTVEKRFIHQYGHPVWARLTLSLVRDSKGRPDYEVAVIENISERKRAEEALRREQAQLQSILDNAPLLISIKDLGGSMLLANRAIFDLLDVPPPDQFIGHSVFELFPKEVADELWSYDLQALHSQQTVRTEERVRHNDGSWHTYLTVRFTVRYLDTLEPFGICSISIDITPTKLAEESLRKAKENLEIRVRERTQQLEKTYRELNRQTEERLAALQELRRNEQLLLQQSRLAAMGEMLGNIAHQWRQPLNTLGLLIQELPLSFELGYLTKESLKESSSKAMQLIKLMSRTIDDFRNFLQPRQEKVYFNVNEAVTTTVSLFEATLKALNIEVEVQEKDQLSIKGHRNEFSQVIMNLITNSRDAFKEREIAAPKLTLRLFREGEKAVVTVADNAGGIPEQIIGRIFEPYFTTKGPDKGTGIGLFMSKNIIEKSMHGSLTVRNTAAGAEFRIEI